MEVLSILLSAFTSFGRVAIVLAAALAVLCVVAIWSAWSTAITILLGVGALSAACCGWLLIELGF